MFLWVAGGAFGGAIVLQSWGGLIVGGLLGYLGARFGRLERRVLDLEKRLVAAQTIPSKFAERVNASTPEPEMPPEAPQQSQTPTPLGPKFEAPSSPPPIAPSHDAGRLADVRPEPKAAPERPLQGLKPAAPWWQEAVDLYQEYLGNRNPIVVVGIVVLFFGVAFFLKYAASQGYLRVPIELRLSGIAAAALAMLWCGWSLRNRRPDFATALQGGGLGIFYLAVFVAFRFYQLLPSLLAFALCLAALVLCGLLSLRQNSAVLAVLATAGGFLAPVLISTGGGSFVALFSFYLLLNTGVFVLAWLRTWRFLPLLGFAFTFLIGLSWGLSYYQPAYFSRLEPFLIAFFLLYVLIPLPFAKKLAALKPSVGDIVLVCATPVIALALQQALLGPNRNALSWSALVAGIIYLALSHVALGFRNSPGTLLGRSYQLFGILFLFVTVPFAFRAEWTSAAWAVMGAALFCFGHAHDRWSHRFFGLLAQLGAGFFFLLGHQHLSREVPLLNGFCLGALTIAGSAFLSAGYVRRARPGMAAFFLIWGLLWWLTGGLEEISQYVADPFQLNTLLLLLVITAAAAEQLWTILDWPALRAVSAALLPLMWAAIIANLAGDESVTPFARGGILVWPLAVAATYWSIFRWEQKKTASYQTVRELGVFLLIGVLLDWELHDLLQRWTGGRGDWVFAAPAFTALVLLLLISSGARFISWPLRAHERFYLTVCAFPMLAVLVIWSFAALAESINPYPIVYLPVLNILDVTQLAAAGALVYWQGKTRRLGYLNEENLPIRQTLWAAGIGALIWISATSARMVHHWLGVQYTMDALYESAPFQSTLSIVWGLVALALIIAAARSRVRLTWLAGAAILALVVVKLFLVDLSKTSGIERTVSFVGIGILMVIIGYFSPLPPKQE